MIDCTIEDTGTYKRTLLNIKYQATYLVALNYCLQIFAEQTNVYKGQCCIT